MKGNCLTVSVRRRKTVLMDGTELSKEMMWGGENLNGSEIPFRYPEWYLMVLAEPFSGRNLVLCRRTGHTGKSPDEVFLLHPGIGFLSNYWCLSPNTTSI